jgi:8-oxo-dGTP pyrophosphatase MutT (NUDIX family)
VELVRRPLPVLVVHKDAPTPTDVHVDVPLGSAQKKKRRKKGEPAEPELSVLKADSEQRIIYGIVLEPDVEDSQGDVVSKEDVELAAHRYLYQQGLAIGDQHAKMAPESVRPVESYIAPVDFEMGGQVVKAGSWVLAAHVPDDNLWEQVKKGHKGAWSVGGSGKRSPLPPVLVRKSGGTTHAGIVVRAADSGRILMLQRSIADESDPARGTWEFPGGEVEQGEAPRQGAVREWQEETGATLPAGEFVGQWKDGIYEGFVYVIPSEKDVPLRLDGHDRLIANPDDPDGDDSESLAWWAPSDARKNPALRAAVKGSDWRAIDAAVPDAVFKTAPVLAPQGPPVHVHVSFGDGSITPVIHNHMPEHGEHTINVHVPEQKAGDVHHHHEINVEPPAVNNYVNVEHPPARSVRVETAEDGSKRYVPE